MLEPHYRNDIWWQIVHPPNFGVPQIRMTRLVVLGSMLGPIKLIEKTRDPSEYATVDETIGNLTPIAAGEVCEHDPI